MSMRVSIVGMGRIGTQAAQRLLAAEPDIALTLYDIEPGRCEDFRGSATLATSAREALEESDTIVLALPREREIDRTLERFSDGNVTAPVAGKLIVDLEPPCAERARSLDQAIVAAGGRYTCAPLAAAVDAPLAETRLLNALARGA
ncbi:MULTISPECIES: NAD(P)-binding domain-containing protein [Achromobacter]|jgi:3-hydroxyisobutyrate dehydrogenase-like beta-hydroxyacid dehydrogenase|uniref:3-hydroxyisobutyrate dehydrogenase n=1 Tax=Achromobacter aegrifaciens TaxID=1287736 RepID=A0AAD2IV47_ACHAE|nr:MULTISPECIES: NAD(P)-binding domain-containing protein [Achromobacter]MBD9421346.1 NAD(P)-binding domain-containing protein [Achromobacter sp. ACM04]MBD9431548.1 NAD(P)-binding domain-containing protein [Achromobacter sp. ACM03]MBD9474751.1 NAD(P)-binding domain-containing protein [Achromobacter sp. ACM01]MDQ1758724.1 NAD(P)-binding domain-containing protein [Achromobacter aegrifaciens]MDR7943979.1 NAD(P)-binding domain-containing protein [Achromobacter aegrifaciens]